MSYIKNNEKFKNYINERAYALVKFEIIKTTPAIKKIEGVTTVLNESETTIELYFEKRSEMLAVDILLFEISDPALKIKKITINDILINNPECEEYIIDFLLKNTKETNKIIIKLEDIDSLYYEFGCIFYKEFKDKPKDWHLNKLLEKYDV